MTNTVTPNATSDDSRAILATLAEDFDLDRGIYPRLEEEFSEDEIDAMRDNAEREWFAECDAVRGGV
jgi:hypothetical protein